MEIINQEIEKQLSDSQVLNSKDLSTEIIIEKQSDQEQGIKPEELEIGKQYKISAPYTRGKYEGQTFDGIVEYYEKDAFADESPMYRFRYIKKPEHFSSIGDSSVYDTNDEGLKWIKKL